MTQAKFSKSVVKPGKYYLELDFGDLLVAYYLSEKNVKSLVKQFKKEGF